MPLTRKVMVLFDPEQYRKLQETAEQRRCSKGALIREAVQKEILARGEASKRMRLEAAKYLVSMKEDIPDWDEMEELITRGHLDG